MATYILQKNEKVINGELFTRYKDSTYFISTDLNIYSGKTSKFLIPVFDKHNKRYVISIMINKIKIKIPIHRMLAEVYIPNPDNLPMVRHLNDIKTDNRLTNLAWGTAKDNMQDASKNGCFASAKLYVGSKNNHSRLNEELVLEIRNLFTNGESRNYIKDKYKLKSDHLSDILNKKTWKHI